MNLIKGLLLLLVCTQLISCSKDDSPTKDPTDLDKESESVINKYKETRKLIGRWNYTGYGKSDFVFLSDGTCLLDGRQTVGYTVGKWNFNPENNLLATTCGSWSWTISFMTEKEWSGITPGGNSFSYNRGYWNDPNDELLIGKWVNEEAGISITFKADNTYTINTAGTSLNGSYEVDTYSPSNWEDEYLYTRYISFKGDVSGKLNVDYLDGYRLVCDKDGGTSMNQYRLTYIFSDFLDK